MWCSVWCQLAALFVWFPFGCRSAWWLASSSMFRCRYFYRVPIRESLFDGDAFSYRFMWRTSTRTDSWHSDSPRRHSCLPTVTGTMALFSPWRCLRFSFRQRDGHFCLTTETGTTSFLAVASGGASFSVHRQCESHSCVAQRQVPWIFSPVRSLSSTVLRTLLSGIRDRSRLASAANHPWTLRPECVGVDRGVGISN